jgi:predicted  nucleic acid-binding Zn-ribbon protein
MSDHIYYPSDHDASIMRCCAECGRRYRAMASELCDTCRPAFASRRLSIDAAGREERDG